MPKFVAIHNLGPGVREWIAESGPSLLAAHKEVYPQVVWNGIYIQWETGKGICLWEAPDADSIISLLKELETPYEDVYPVEWVTPHDLATGA